MMNLIFIGDVVGKCGCDILSDKLFDIKKRYNADIVIVNGENSAIGNGISKSSIDSIFSSGADVITTGNHVFQKTDAMQILGENECVLRPANYPDGTIGNGSYIIDMGRAQIAIINLMGTLLMEPLDNPFFCADKLLEGIDTPNIIVDFHAEATSEKKGMGFYLAKRVTAVLGTHTHVQTADETIIDNHTAYITDVGMTGSEDSIIGFDKQCALTRMKNHIPVRFCEADISPFICGIHLEFDEKCGKALSIERFIIR